MRAPETYKDDKGYLRYTDSNYLVHRRIMEKWLKRKLDPDEIVHHKNRNKLDNSLGNLEVVSRKEHYKIHVVPMIQAKREAKTAKAIIIGFVTAGAILFVVGLITRAKLDLWYLGSVFLLSALIAWYFVLRKK